MNKTHLITGGVGLACTAVGAGAGYLFARRQFNATLDERITVEVDATKKYYALQLMELANNKPSNILDVPISEDLEEEEEDEPTEEEVVRKEVLRNRAGVAQTNYQGFHKPEPGEVVASNVFGHPAKDKAPLPPRDESTGRFSPRRQTIADERRPQPYLISQDAFLAGPEGADFEQEYLMYFVNDDTLLQVHDRESVDLALVGDALKLGIENLTPEQIAEEHVCVRNEQLEIDYEIKLMTESVTEYIGLDGPYDENEQSKYV